MRINRTSRSSFFAACRSSASFATMRSATLRTLVLVLRLVFPFSRRHLRAALVAVLLAATLVAGLNAPAAYGMGISHLSAQRPAPQGKPNHANPTSGTKSVLHAPPPYTGKLPSYTPLTQRPAMVSLVPSVTILQTPIET